MSGHMPPYYHNRLFEWGGTLMMVQLGLLAILTSVLMDASPQLAFIAFSKMGLSQEVTGLIFFTTGVCRAVALKRNGEWHNGPAVRAVCAVIGAVMWGQLLFGIIEVYLTTGAVYLSVAVWDTLLLCEGVSFSRAMRDRKAAQPVSAGNEGWVSPTHSTHS